MRLLFCIAVLHLCFCGFGAAQVASPQPGEPQAPRETSPPVSSMPASPATGPGLFLRGVPSGKATPEVLRLSLSTALDLGLKRNLGLLTGEQATRSAEASRYRALSGLLPDIIARTAETGEQFNLKALGFPGFPGINPILGPFNIFDARMLATQPILDFAALRKNRAGSESLLAARHSYQDARDIVVLVVADLYLQAVSGSSRIEASRAQVDTAQALYQRALEMKKAGVAPGIDVLRAQVELQARQQRLIFFRNEFEKQKLALARAIGLPVGQQFELTDRLPYSPPPPVTFDQALEEAYRSRADYRSALARVRAAEFSRQGAVAGRLPSLAFNGDYGDIGPRIWNSHGTFSATVSLNIPVFQGERVRADVLAADAALQLRKAELEDVRSGIDYEIRTAFLDLKSSGEQVQVARNSLDLAGEQLKQAQDRFSAGVTSSIEVVQAQEAVATADENYISSLHAYNLAKATLARALGGAEKSAREFLGIATH
jgi:outer membrane protein TolC